MEAKPVLITRRKFLQIFSGSIAGLALSNLWLPKLLQAADVKNGKGRLPIVWFQGQNCSGCPVSFINTEYCLLYTSDAADDLTRVDLGGRRIIKKKKKI